MPDPDVPDPDGGFARLWEAHYADVLRYAARRTDHETARDVAAETFLVAWRRRGDIPPDRPFPWLLNVARHVLSNELRGHRRRSRLRDRLRGTARPDQARDVAAALAEGGRVAAALRRLSDRDREALRLVGWEELDARDAATAAGCSVKTFSVRLHRARRRLAAALAEIDAADRPAPAAPLQRSPQL
ncbi:RNA polymerase sigma factor [Actinomadura opuntiae]|uniref:RNA polymerase sigma factor n=1 Tax=Actinomadura sp. OS1-43 TaxID=604315 RepID=UPI00255AFC76|nr:sigma-70 family RNA polymerase sigma factor [Actinomadura sp. OS1-43]MDL4820386.1 sigma-70 family RNA polymerase sigma factor [Actinomadura sp. OS1-43]